MPFDSEILGVYLKKIMTKNAKTELQGFHYLNNNF